MVLVNIPIVGVLDGCPLSCQKAKSLDLSRQKRVDDEDDGLGTTVEVQLLKEEIVQREGNVKENKKNTQKFYDTV